MLSALARLTLIGWLLLATAHAADIDLPRIMADPEWMGSPVEAAWWQLDGQGVIYQVKRDGSPVRDLFHIDLARRYDRQLDHAEQAGLDAADPIFHAASGQALFLREGQLFLRGADGQSRQLTHGAQAVAQPAFDADGRYIVYRQANQWWRHAIDQGLARQVADLRFEKDPDAEPEDSLTQAQLRLFSSLREDRDRARAEREEARLAARADPTRAPAPWYLGDDVRPGPSALSPDGRWLLLAVTPARHDAGRAGQMPHYVTEDGYLSIEEVRTLVGRNLPAAQRIWLLDLQQREKHELSLDALPGIQQDPLAELKRAQELDPLAEGSNRAVSIMGIRWHARSHRAAVMIRAIDNKDRWIASLDPEAAELKPRHRLNDPAWINWTFNDFGWRGETDEIWFLSEESGFSHFYTVGADRGAPIARTRGRFEVMDPVMSLDGNEVWLLSNRSHPTEYDLYRLDLSDNALTRLTEHRGIESFAVLPEHDRILLRYSEPYLPPQVALVAAEGGAIEPLTDTRKPEFRDIEWQPPLIVGVESSHGAGPIWSKFYPARSERPESGHPVVLFVHGAGYLQNAHWRYPQYFREQMFHNLLSARGYHVLDMDFRASKGYGRDWRTAIYRQMGTPELEDLIDGVNWLVSEHGADPERVGLYGGSYGGFMTFMAMFNAPEVFTAGAALRPVTDWAHYNHFYTSNILNTPEVDPEAYRRSSPIEFAEGLRGHLLMTHGMLDDNVFYQDVVRLAQRLIDLEKENWELASYPLERHGFTRASSWLDQYRRILKLFEITIGGH